MRTVTSLVRKREKKRCHSHPTQPSNLQMINWSLRSRMELKDTFSCLRVKTRTKQIRLRQLEGNPWNMKVLKITCHYTHAKIMYQAAFAGTSMVPTSSHLIRTRTVLNMRNDRLTRTQTPLNGHTTQHRSSPSTQSPIVRATTMLKISR